MSVTKILRNKFSGSTREFHNSLSMLLVPGFGILRVEIRRNGSGKNTGPSSQCRPPNRWRFELSVAVSREEATCPIWVNRDGLTLSSQRCQEDSCAVATSCTAKPRERKCEPSAFAALRLFKPWSDCWTGRSAAPQNQSGVVADHAVCIRNVRSVAQQTSQFMYWRSGRVRFRKLGCRAMELCETAGDGLHQLHSH
jgi:hypothetical protein